MIRYRVGLRRNADGRVHFTRWAEAHQGSGVTEMDSLRGIEFWWTEGNMACDCNRHGEFERIADPDCGNLAMEYGCGNRDYDLVWFEVEGMPRMTPRELYEYLTRE